MGLTLDIYLSMKVPLIDSLIKMVNHSGSSYPLRILGVSEPHKFHFPSLPTLSLLCSTSYILISVPCRSLDFPHSALVLGGDARAAH